MRKGDYIHIASRSEKMVAVFGEVNSPRSQLWTAGLGLIEAISNVGGLRDEHWEYAVIMRGGMGNLKFYRADLQAILHGEKPNVALEAVDIIYIPEDGISGYNVFVNRLLPTAQLLSMLVMPVIGGRTEKINGQNTTNLKWANAHNPFFNHEPHENSCLLVWFVVKKVLK